MARVLVPAAYRSAKFTALSGNAEVAQDFERVLNDAAPVVEWVG